MANQTGLQTINNAQIIEIDSDPTTGGGLNAPFGTVAIFNTGSSTVIYLKTGSGNTNWTQSPSDVNGVLSALAAYNSNGLLTQTALATFVARSIAVGSTKLSISNGNGVSGDPTLDVVESNLTLNNISGTLGVSKGGTGLTTFGGSNTLLYTTATDTLSFVSTANNGTLITSGAGVPSISSTLPSAVQGNITTVGTITTGTWNGTAIDATHGGTGQTTYAIGDILYASTTSVLSKLADVATGNALISGGVTTAPSWGKIGLTTHVSGTLSIANGGTNSGTALTANAIAVSNGTAIVQGPQGTTTTVLHGNASGLPTYGAVSLTTDVSGILPIANGGTNLSALGTANQILGVNTGATGLEYKTVTAGTHITITPAAGSITIANVFGESYQKFTSLNEQSTTSTTLVTAFSGTTTSLTSGTYYVTWSFEVSQVAAQDVLSRVSINSIQISGRAGGTASQGGADTKTRVQNGVAGGAGSNAGWISVSGSDDMSLSGTVPVLVQFAANANTAWIRNIIVILWRTS